jgi:hypothetical protein
MHHTVRALLVSFVAVLAACADTQCENTVQHEIASPGQRRKAVLFARDCGATTSTSTHLSILPMGSELSGGTGNVLIVGDGMLSLRWAADDLLIVELGGRRTYKKESFVAGVCIEYRP